jgi:hypothetical protein
MPEPLQFPVNGKKERERGGGVERGSHDAEGDEDNDDDDDDE